MLKAILDYFGIKITYDDVVEKKYLSDDEVKKKYLHEGDVKKSINPPNVSDKRPPAPKGSNPYLYLLHLPGIGGNNGTPYCVTIEKRFKLWIEANNLSDKQKELVMLIQEYTSENRFLTFNELHSMQMTKTKFFTVQQIKELTLLNNIATVNLS